MPDAESTVIAPDQVPSELADMMYSDLLELAAVQDQ